MISGLGQRGAVVAIPQNSPSQQHEAHTGAYGASRRENRRPLSVTVGCYGIVAHGMKLPHTQTANARHHAVTSTQAVISKSLVAEKRIPALNHRVTRGASVVWKVARFLCRAWSPMEALHRKRLRELGFHPSRRSSDGGGHGNTSVWGGQRGAAVTRVTVNRAIWGEVRA